MDEPKIRVRLQKETRLVTLAQGLLAPFIHENQENLEDRKGICLAILDLNVRYPEVRIFTIGTVPPEKLEEKQKFAKEKVQWLEGKPRHLTSFESQKPTAGRYGGAVRVNKKLLMAASGFPAFLDQEFCIMLTLLDYQMPLLRAHEIRQRTIHEYPHPLHPYL